VTEQVPHIHQLVPSLITLNAKGLLTPVQPVHGATSNWDTCRINQQLTDCIARSIDGYSSAPEKESSITALHIQDNDKKRRKETNSRFALSEKLQFTKVIIDSIFQILKPHTSLRLPLQRLDFLSIYVQCIISKHLLVYVHFLSYFVIVLHYITYSWSWALPEKLPMVQPLKNFPTFYGTRRSITAFTRGLHWSLS
jgi:hypothetical protein